MKQPCSTDSTNSTGSTNRTNNTGSTNSTNITDSTNSTDITNSTNSTNSTDRTNSTDSTNSTNSPDSTNSTNSTDSTNAIQSCNPVSLKRGLAACRCSGVNHCSFRLTSDYPVAEDWGPGVVFIKYACINREFLPELQMSELPG